MAGTLFFLPVSTAFDDAGLSEPGAECYFFLAGTSTLTPAYLDSNATTPATNPVVADAAGRLPPLWLDPEIDYKVVLRAPIVGSDLGAIRWQADNYNPSPSTQSFPIYSDNTALASETDADARLALTNDGVAFTSDGTTGFTASDADGENAIVNSTTGSLFQRVARVEARGTGVVSRIRQLIARIDGVYRRLSERLDRQPDIPQVRMKNGFLPDTTSYSDLMAMTFIAPATSVLIRAGVTYSNKSGGQVTTERFINRSDTSANSSIDTFAIADGSTQALPKDWPMAGLVIGREYTVTFRGRSQQGGSDISYSAFMFVELT